jgi:hypothetical protein
MNDQVERLYLAAKELKGVEGVSAIARLLDALPQTINNWSDRPISDNGLVKAQEHIGCDAVWLRDGTGDMVKGQAVPDYSPLVRLVQCFSELPNQFQVDLLRTAEALLAASRTSNKPNTLRQAK